MCLILHNPEALLVDEDIIDSALCFNPDGFGIFYHDTGEVRRTMSASKAAKWCAEPRPYTAHFRYSTSGKTNKKSCHPFDIDGRYLLMQNGTLERLRSSTKVDTAVLAGVLAEVPREHWRALLETHPCRFAICDTKTGKVELYNEDLWTEHEGCLYSKPDVLEDLYYTNSRPTAAATTAPGGYTRYDDWEEEWETGLRSMEREESGPAPTSARHVVAVYGTLKQGCGNHDSYLADAYYRGSGTTASKYPLVVSGLPFLFKRKGSGYNVEVEVYSVTDAQLQSLDGLEGHPTWYRRSQVAIDMADGTLVEAWVYFMLDQTEDTGHYLDAY